MQPTFKSIVKKRAYSEEFRLELAARNGTDGIEFNPPAADTPLEILWLTLRKPGSFFS